MTEEITWESQLPALKALIAWDDEDYLEMESTIQQISNFNPAEFNNETFQVIHNYWYDLASRFPISKVELDQKYLFRARQNIGDEVFSEEWQISYNSRRKDIIQLGRFNKPQETVFYAAVPYDNSQHFVITATLEACKEIFDDTSCLSEFDLTITRWEVKQPFFMVSLCHDERHLKRNDRLYQSVDRLLTGIKTVGSEKAYLLIKKVWEMMTHYCCVQNPTPNDYFISTALFGAIRNYYGSRGEPVLAMLYPSAMTEKDGLNIVLTTDAVDQFLRPDTAVMYRVKRLEDKKSYKGFALSDAAKIVNGKFQFSRIDESEGNFEIPQSS